MNITDFTDEQLRMIINLTESRTLNIEKDALRQAEVQYLWSDELEKEVKDYWDGLNKWWKSKKMPPCTCEGFMASERYNPYFYDGEPCSAKWASKCKKEGLLRENNDSKESK